MEGSGLVRHEHGKRVGAENCLSAQDPKEGGVLQTQRGVHSVLTAEPQLMKPSTEQSEVASHGADWGLQGLLARLKFLGTRVLHISDNACITRVAH